MKSKKEDKSLHVQQSPKIKTELNIRQFPWTEKQKELISLIQRKDVNIIFISGPAGTAKTLCSIYAALEALNSKKIGEIVYVRSIVESSNHHLGFLPGDFSEKISPYLQPLYDKLSELLIPSHISFLNEQKKIRGIPIGFMRGLSINSAYIIGDEAQNFHQSELLNLCTRIGKFSKLILTGDLLQPDIKDSGFKKIYEAFSDEDSKKHGIYTFHFGLEDIMRSEVVKYIVQRFSQLPR